MSPEPPFVPLAVPDLSGNEASYLAEAIESTWVSSSGPFLQRFEAAIAEATGASGAFVTSSGTTALHLALMVAGVRPGDLVIVPSLTFIASANAISHAGADPWFIDIEERSWGLDATRVENALSSATSPGVDGPVHTTTGRRIGAIMPVFTLGNPTDMASTASIAEQYGIPIVIDAAPALGADVGGRPMTQFASLACLSFNGNKTVTSGGGGAIVSDDEALVDRARHIGSTARVSADYEHDEVGYNYRMTNLEAAVGLAQIERLEGLLARKQAIRLAYDRAFESLNGVGPFPTSPFGRSTHWLSGVVLPETGPDVASVCQALRTERIEARPLWRPAHLQTPYAGAPAESLPVTENLWSRLVTLPSSSSMTEEEQSRVIATTTRILRNP